MLKTNPSPREVYAIVGDPEIDHQYWGRPQERFFFSVLLYGFSGINFSGSYDDHVSRHSEVLNAVLTQVFHEKMENLTIGPK